MLLGLGYGSSKGIFKSFRNYGVLRKKKIFHVILELKMAMIRSIQKVHC